jgi:hypothetical protein
VASVVFIEVIRAEHVIKKLVAVIRTARGLKKLNPFKNVLVEGGNDTFRSSESR